MMIVPFGTDVKVTLIPKIGEDIVPKETIKHLKVCIVRGNSKKGFTPIYKVGDAGIDIEIQRHHIKSPGVYKIILDWRRPDAAYYDGYQDISNNCSFINFSTSCKVMSDNTADIEISPIYKGDKGDKGDSAYQIWLDLGNVGTYEEYIAYLRQPATDAAGTANAAAGLADTARTELTTAVNTKLDEVDDKIEEMDTTLSTYDGRVTQVESDIDQLAGSKVDKSSIVGETGTDINKTMSQNAITDNLELKIDKTSIKQVLGTSTTDVMSQKGITDYILPIKQRVDESFFKLESEIYGENISLGCGISTNNKIVPSDIALITPNIPVSNGDAIEWVHKFMTTNDFRLTLYDSNGIVLDSWGAGDLGYRTMSVSYENAAYIRATMNNAASDECFVKVNDVKVWNDSFYKDSIKEKIEGVKTRLSSVEGKNTEQDNKISDLSSEKTPIISIFGEDVILGYGLAYDARNNLILLKDSGVIVSPFIPIVEGDSIEWVHRFNTSNNFRAVMYDSNKQVLDSWGAGDLGYRTIAVTNDNAAYFRFTMNNASSDECFVKVNDTKVWNDSFYKDSLKNYINRELRELADNSELIRRRRFAELNGEVVEEDYDFLSTTGTVGYISPYLAISGEVDVWLSYSKVVGYDENKNFVTFWRTNDEVATISIPSNVKYIRVAFYKEYITRSYIKDHATQKVLWKPFQITKANKSILELFPQEEYEPAIANIMNDFLLDSPNRKEVHTFGMLMMGDLHSCNNILREIIEFNNVYQPYLNASILVGDMVNQWDDGFDWWGEVGAKRILPIIGNHETLYDYHNYTQGSGMQSAPKVNGVEVDIYKLTCISAKQCYDRYIQPYLAQTGFTSYVEDKCYWYKDYTDCQVRLIGLDDMHWKESVPLVNGTTSSIYPDGTSVDTGEQQIWFRNTLEDARVRGYKVIVAHHTPAGFEVIDCPFSIIDFNNVGTRSKATDDELAEVQTFIDAGGTFVAWITGHLHQDVVGTCKGYVGNAVNNYPNQLQIAIDASRFAKGIKGNRYYQGGNYKIADTKSQYCLNVLAVTEDTITIKRVGSEYDKIGRKIESFVYNFMDNEIVHK